MLLEGSRSLVRKQSERVARMLARWPGMAWHGMACVAGPESAGVLGVGEGEAEAGGGARLSCVGLCGPSSDTRFIASICSLFRPIRLFA